MSRSIRMELPSLAKEGWPRHQVNGPVPLKSAARSVSPVGRNIKNGVVRSASDNRWLEPTTPSAPAKEVSRHFLNGRSHPSLSKEGTSAFPSVVFNAPVSSKRCGTWQACSRRGIRTHVSLPRHTCGRSVKLKDIDAIRSQLL